MYSGNREIPRFGIIREKRPGPSRRHAVGASGADVTFPLTALLFLFIGFSIRVRDLYPMIFQPGLQEVQTTMFDYATYLKQLHEGNSEINPFLGFMGIRYESIKEGYARFRMTIRPEYLQGAGLVQGGVMVAMADESIAHAIMPLLKENEGLTTVELKSNFLAPVKEGDLIAEATVFKKGKSIIIGDCLIKNDQDRPVLRCTATFLIVTEKEKPARKTKEQPIVAPETKKEDNRQTQLF